MGGAGWIRMMSESGPMISGIPAVDFWISCTRTHTPEPPEMQECIENTRGSSAYGRKIGVYLPRDDAHPTVDLDGMPLWWHWVDLNVMPLRRTWMECPCGRLGWDALKSSIHKPNIHSSKIEHTQRQVTLLELPHLALPNCCNYTGSKTPR